MNILAANVSDQLPLEHAALLATIVDGVRRDDRIEALLAGGSMVHGGFDELSDLDLIVIVRENAYAEVAAQKRAFAEQFGELLAAFTGEHVGEPRLLICLYGPHLLHVDLKFIVRTDLNHLVERPIVLFARDGEAIEGALNAATIEWPERSPDWFEERAWIWLHYGATKLQRGELLEAMGMLAFFREQVLGPMLHRRHGRPQRGVRKIEQIGTESADIRGAVADYSKEGIASALATAMRLYLDLRRDQPPAAITPGMPDLLMPFLETGGTGPL